MRHLQRLAVNLETFNRQVTCSATPRCRIKDVIQCALGLCETSLTTSAHLRLTLEPNLPDANIGSEILQRAITQYLLSACATFNADKRGAISILSHLREDTIVVIVESAAPLRLENRSDAGLVADLEIIEQLGGRCSLESLSEGSTRLSITLPAVGAEG